MRTGRPSTDSNDFGSAGPGEWMLSSINAISALWSTRNAALAGPCREKAPTEEPPTSLTHRIRGALRR